MRQVLYCSIVLSMVFVIGCKVDESSSKDFIPEGVVLISPVHDEVCELGVKYDRNSSRLLFEWEWTKNAQLYDLVITNLETGENYITYTGISDNFKELVLRNEVSYSWQVIARNVNTPETSASEVWEFFFAGEPRANHPPHPANILSPNASEIVSAFNGQITLEWEGSDRDQDELTFTVFLDMMDGHQPTTEDLKNLTKSMVTVSVYSGQTYYWRVLSHDGAGSTSTQVQTFTVN